MAKSLQSLLTKKKGGRGRIITRRNKLEFAIDKF